MTTAPLPPGLARNSRLDRWVEIRTDGVVEVRTGKVEIGQGITSALAQIAAEELDVDYARIRMIPADTGRSPNEGVTAGSRSTMDGGGALRQACAEVRDAFLQAAARRLNAGVDELFVRDGTVHRKASNESATYWELSAEVDLSRDADGRAAPKRADQLTLGRQAAAAARPARQGGGRWRLPARPGAAGHAARPGRAPALLSRGAPGLRRQADRDDAGRAGRGARRALPRRRRRARGAGCRRGGGAGQGRRLAGSRGPAGRRCHAGLPAIPAIEGEDPEREGCAAARSALTP